MRFQAAAAAERPEQAIGMRELVYRALGVDDLRQDPRGVGDAAERLSFEPSTKKVDLTPACPAAALVC